MFGNARRFLYSPRCKRRRIRRRMFALSRMVALPTRPWTHPFPDKAAAHSALKHAVRKCVTTVMKHSVTVMTLATEPDLSWNEGRRFNNLLGLSEAAFKLCCAKSEMDALIRMYGSASWGRLFQRCEEIRVRRDQDHSALQAELYNARYNFGN